ncbi:hypothetical protein DFQ28_011695 [Apophysomyces sp. BC1034]|nr:hypothetical protein DFQ30_011264 [Apophysomyces sp. BC1015]KAG0177804.1 hypothetical protein DFQ29_004315 [Apophysomyces sp. BC1021]KAG0191510.1 hypothetical protein DFQ28_011695 [Apophysomyces sp. BC1034]
MMESVMYLFKHSKQVEPCQDENEASTSAALGFRRDLSKFLSDPMRTSDTPHVLGGFRDPMSVGRGYPYTSVGCDVTDTGA